MNGAGVKLLRRPMIRQHISTKTPLTYTNTLIMTRSLLMLIIFSALSGQLSAQTVINLYDQVPGSKPAPIPEKVDADPRGFTRIERVNQPTLTIYLPPKEKATGTAVIICPGGGYARLAYTHEGTDVAKKLNEMGIAAFLLKYRLPDDAIMTNKEIGPLQDAQRALQMVRERAKEWGVNKKKVGIMGFSAGGHLASTAGTHFEHAYIASKRSLNLRPDFMVLVYPVISFDDSLMHGGSRTNLLGPQPSPEKIKEYSNELQVNAKTPPTFLTHAQDDKTVPVKNSIRFYEQLQAYKVPSELYLYEKGGHGFGMNNKTSDVKWMDLAAIFLKKNGF